MHTAETGFVKYCGFKFSTRCFTLGSVVQSCRIYVKIKACLSARCVSYRSSGEPERRVFVDTVITGVWVGKRPCPLCFLLDEFSNSHSLAPGCTRSTLFECNPKLLHCKSETHKQTRHLFSRRPRKKDQTRAPECQLTNRLVLTRRTVKEIIRTSEDFLQAKICDKVTGENARKSYFNGKML